MCCILLCSSTLSNWRIQTSFHYYIMSKELLPGWEFSCTGKTSAIKSCITHKYMYNVKSSQNVLKGLGLGSLQVHLQDVMIHYASFLLKLSVPCGLMRYTSSLTPFSRGGAQMLCAACIRIQHSHVSLLHGHECITQSDHTVLSGNTTQHITDTRGSSYDQRPYV